MIRRIWSALIASITPQDTAPSDLEQARKAYEDALAAYLEAKGRGDTRGMNAAQRVVKAKRTAALDLEMSR